MECAACGLFGCRPDFEGCTYFRRTREGHEDAQPGDHVPHITQTEWWREGALVVIPNAGGGQDLAFSLGQATGAQSNCLIDTLRQALDLVCDVSRVRHMLRSKHPAGPGHVTEFNYLTLDLHWKDIVDMLFQTDESGKPKLHHAMFRIVCVELSFEKHGVMEGTGPRVLYIAREEENHFIPLIRARHA